MERTFSLIQVHKALEHNEIKPYHSKLSRKIVVDIIRESLEKIREDIKNGKTPPTENEIIKKCKKNLDYNVNLKIRKVINATGTILHTNLGRSPINEEIWDKVKEVNISASNLEYDLNKEQRGKRGTFLYKLLANLTGTESALVVNNNAAAVFLILYSLAKPKNVIVSRGEQVQIGGGFRIPDILNEAGCKLIEVGTTNITTVKDYTDAIDENTSLILKVHSSNFKIRGFTETPSLLELRKVTPKHIPIVYDEGAGIFETTLTEDMHIKTAIKNGADLVCFSGDKIFGSVQAGIIVGKKELIEKIAKNPLMRAFRAGKTILSILEETVIRKLNEEETGLGYFEKLIIDREKIKSVCNNLIKGLKEFNISVIESEVESGGGAMPDTYFKSYAIEIKIENPEKLITSLHNLQIPIIAKIKNNSVILHLITIDKKDLLYVKESLQQLLKK